jgi:hypothetical protein
MNVRVQLLVNRFVEAAGEAIATPAGVNVDLLRAYGRHRSLDVPHFYGNEIPSRCGG